MSLMIACGKKFWSINATRYFTCGIDKFYNHKTGSKVIFCPKCKKHNDTISKDSEEVKK